MNPFFWYQHFQNSEYILVDIADEMLAVAKQRFESLENVSYQIMDYSQMLPDGEFDVIASALSIHHLENEEKAELFCRIYDKLPEGGLFVNYDQFCGGSKEMCVDLYAANTNIDLVISDITLPDGNGIVKVEGVSGKAMKNSLGYAILNYNCR